jgi:hypothetical protein
MVPKAQSFEDRRGRCDSVLWSAQHHGFCHLETKSEATQACLPASHPHDKMMPVTPSLPHDSETVASCLQVVIATKVAGYSRDSYLPGQRNVPPTTEKADARLDAASIEAALAASLRRLRTEYVDLYQLHWPDRYVPLFGQ